MAKQPGQTMTEVEMEQLRTLKARLDDAHAVAVAALERGDHEIAASAIRLQREILDEQHKLVLFRLSRGRSMQAVSEQSPHAATDRRATSVPDRVWLPADISPDEIHIQYNRTKWRVTNHFGVQGEFDTLDEAKAYTFQLRDDQPDEKPRVILHRTGVEGPERDRS